MSDVVSVEREIKVEVPDLEAVEGRLRDLVAEGATFEGVEHEVNEILDTPDHALNNRRQRLRLRTLAGQPGVTITWKGAPEPGSSMKSREEQECHADNAAACALIFRRLGFAPTLTYEKERATWRWQGLSITLDRLVFGTFLEIEIERNVDRADEDRLVLTCLDRLGLTNAPRVEESYAMLQAQWDRDHGKGDGGSPLA